MAETLTVASETVGSIFQEGLIEKWTHKRVANHLLDSKLFSKLGSNDLFSINPPVLHFAGFVVGSSVTRTFEIVNKSDIVQRLHIIPPQSKFFKVHYTKQERFVPGGTIKCRVDFSPTEWRYHYDCIRLHCPEQENLILPIHAYPVVDTSSFPSVLTFQDVSIGESHSKYIPLRSHVPVEFQFSIKFLNKPYSFSICPMNGIVPKNGEIAICVTFTPQRFATESIQFQLDIAQFDAPHLVCLVTGSCSSKVAPLDPKRSEKVVGKSEKLRLDPVSISPLARARQRYLQQIKADTVDAPSTHDSANADARKAADNALLENVEYWRSHAVVNKILLHDPGKMRSKDLKQAMTGKSSEENRQTKAARFESELRKADYKERQNQLIWQTNLGSEPLKESIREKVVLDRKSSWRRYINKRGDLSGQTKFDEGSSHVTIRVTFRRTYRLFDIHPISTYGGPTFDPYNNDFWRIKLERLELFQQVSRAVLIRNRANEKIAGLRKLKAAFQAGRRSVNPEDIVERKSSSKLSISEPSSDSIKVARKKYVSELPIDVKENITDVPIAPLAFWVTGDAAFERKPVYHQIRVTRQFQLLGFNPVGISSLSYAAKNAPGRPYRSGAEDELAIGSAPAKTISKTTENANETKVEAPVIARLNVPSFLMAKSHFSAERYSGKTLLSYYQPLPYSEGDADAQFCPSARYPNIASQRSKGAPNVLHERDVIKGIMSWRNLPAAGPLATASLPCSTQLLSLRFSDSPEPGDLLPTPPSLLRRPPDSDKDILTELESSPTSGDINLTPELIAAKFEIIKTPMTKPLLERPAAGAKGRKIQPEAAKARDQNKKSDRDAAVEEPNRPVFKMSSRASLYNEL